MIKERRETKQGERRSGGGAGGARVDSTERSWYKQKRI